MLSVRMIILILKTHFANLLITFNDCSYQGRFHSEWRKAEVVPVDKKEDIQCLKNYWPISLLPTCSKSFECLIYNTVFTYLRRMIWFLQTNQNLELTTFAFMDMFFWLHKFLIKNHKKINEMSIILEKIVVSVMAYSSCFMRAIVSRMRLPLFKIFANFIFVQIFKYFALFSPFLVHFLKKSHTCPYFLE